MLSFPLSYFPADIPLIVFNRPSKTTQVRILNFDLMNLPIFLVGSCHSAVLPLHDVLPYYRKLTLHEIKVLEINAT